MKIGTFGRKGENGKIGEWKSHLYMNSKKGGAWTNEMPLLGKKEASSQKGDVFSKGDTLP